MQNADLVADQGHEAIGARAAGEPLPALGEGKACEYCAARGLCRKDFWTE